ncbi:MAG: hybrid sensor histidine kinase/response regulator [Gammaproteobacteria bacterium]|nr:hybrid sensor histidine kinase/response regulator [Gammaproteobacteria bacterium]
MNIIPTLFSNNGNTPLFDDAAGKDAKTNRQRATTRPIKILIIDDEEDIHRVTEMVLGNYTYKNRPLEMLSAYSANHARQLLEQHKDIAVILLDVVMETDNAGLELVDYTRNVINNKHVRIILRTGQPGQAPESKVIQNYDINDYREKSELTAGKLISAVTAAIRNYLDIQVIEQLALDKSQLETLVAERTRNLEELNRDLDKLVKQRTAELEIEKENAEAASLAKTEFLSRVSHELRTPMNAIMGFAQLMDLDRNDFDKEHATALQEILKASEHLLTLINELIEISSIESGYVELQIEPVNLCNVVHDALELMKPMADKRDINLIDQTKAHDDIFITTDITRLRQVLINLLTNAIKYNREQGTVTVDCRSDRDEDNIILEIKDTGIGIPTTSQLKIFQPFHRVDPYHAEEGSGLGLSVCKTIVEILGGDMGVQSDGETGSTFWFSLPLKGPTQLH